MNLKSTESPLFVLVLLLISRDAIDLVEGQNSPWNTRLRFDNVHSKFQSFPDPTTARFSSSKHREIEKIAGGSYASEGQFPFMAVVHRLIDNGAISQCGGTVISKRWVLTAGHCISKLPHRFFVTFGVINKSGIGYDYNLGPGVSMMTSKVFVHPEYFYSTNDIGLVYMPRDIPYTKNIQPIRLAGKNETEDTFADTTAYVIGWGRDKQTGGGTKGLKYAMLPIIRKKECEVYWKVDERNICTTPGLGQNACQGDSGGPLVIMRNKMPLQIGIVSYGDSNCPSGRPGVFTRITAFSKWIESVTGVLE